ncbi:hypothetical protein D3C86_1578140 [compost metagenome]
MAHALYGHAELRGVAGCILTDRDDPANTEHLHQLAVQLVDRSQFLVRELPVRKRLLWFMRVEREDVPKQRRHV